MVTKRLLKSILHFGVFCNFFLQETREVIDGVVPFFREKPKDVALTEGEPLQLSCLVASEPKAAIHWLKNDLIFMEDSRLVKVVFRTFNIYF